MKSLRARIHVKPWQRLLMALIFAGLCTFVAGAELWMPSLRVEPGVAAPVSLRLPPGYFRITMLRSEFHYLPTASRGCGDVVGRGDVVEPGSECAGMVTAFENSRRAARPARQIGSAVLFLIVGFLLSSYMSREGMGRTRWLRSQLVVFVSLLVLMAASKAILLFTDLSFTILPVGLLPLVFSLLLGRRLSFGLALSSSILISALVNYDIQALFVFFAQGVSAVSAQGMYKRRTRRALKIGLRVALGGLVATALTTILFAGTLDIYDDLADHLNVANSIWLAAIAGGLACGLLAAILAPVVSLAIDEVSRAKLVDLLELDHPLLRQIRERAPSTWEHSRAMANLGEAAAHAIDGNAMLVRVGAYFHDVGKSIKPEFFIENQSGGYNPHDDLTPADSARAIFKHVVEGVKLLRRHRVPEDVIEFSYSHHGNSVLEYFWMKQCQGGNEENLQKTEFCYPGHKPTTRETAILMIVDAMEAAARTVEAPNRQKFETLLQRIVFGKMAQGQFDESGMTMQDLRIVINNVVDTLVSMYHARIKYPWQEKEGNKKTDQSNSKPNNQSESTEEITLNTPKTADQQATPAVVATPMVTAVREEERENVADVPDVVPTLTPAAPHDETTEPKTETTFTGPLPNRETGRR